MNAPTPEQIAKLPKWAQERIADLERRTATAELVLKEFQDAQTPSPIFYDDLVCIGSGGPQFVRRYVQSSRVSIVRDGVRADVLLRADGDTGIEISWGDEKRGVSQVAMVPLSFQKVVLLSKAQLR